jgi:hypothetical protein
MPGYWEIKPTVFTAILYVDSVNFSWACGLRRLRLHGPEPVGYSGMPYDMARNQAAMNCLDSGCDYLFFLDSDVVPPPDAVERLIARNVPVVSGVYARRSPPETLPVAMINGQWLSPRLPKNKLLDVHLVGAGCLLVKREVLKALPPLDAHRGKHWFDWRVDMRSTLPPGRALSEDYSFCVHCWEHGIPVKLDTSVRCVHQGMADYIAGRQGPINTLNPAA